jgi:hypothetical protein
MREGQRYPVLYVLPVEPGEGTRWGSALAEVKRHDLHNEYGLICVYPTFSQLPWYADHPTDRGIRQKTLPEKGKTNADLKPRPARSYTKITLSLSRLT